MSSLPRASTSRAAGELRCPGPATSRAAPVSSFKMFPHGRVHSRTLAMAKGRPKNYIYTQTDRDKTPILYKRD